MAAKGGLQGGENMKSNAELVDYLSGIIKSKEGEVHTQTKHINEVLTRERELKDKLGKLEFLYELDPNKPLIKYDSKTLAQPQQN